MFFCHHLIVGVWRGHAKEETEEGEGEGEGEERRFVQLTAFSFFLVDVSMCT